MQATYDIIVIGSGAGGAAAAYRLAQAGRAVLVLEKGEALPTDGSTQDVGTVLERGAFASKEVWRDGRGRRFTPRERFNLGGKTMWSGAAFSRFSPGEFLVDSAFQYHAWPIGYEELAPYYDEAERLLDVRSFAVERDLAAILGTLRRSGWRERPLNLGLASDILDHPADAKKLDGFALPSGRKSDAARLLSKISSLPNVVIEAGRPVADLLADGEKNSRIAGVACADGARFFARDVVLAAGALHSPRLLFRYLRNARPDHGVPGLTYLGRYYKRQLRTTLIAFSSRVTTDVLRSTVLVTHDRFPHSSVRPLGVLDDGVLATLCPRFLPAVFAEALGRRAYGFQLRTEDGSHRRNRIISVKEPATPTLDVDDRRIRMSVGEHRGLVRAFRRSLLGAGWWPSATRATPVDTANACGTMVAGADRATSVVGPDGKVHEFDNLYVCDGSVLPRSGRADPALTIYAWSLRVADGIVRRRSEIGATARREPSGVS
jgi:choline dehydrogenase-like flavoprotein